MTLENIHYLNLFLGTGAIIAQILSVVTLGLLFLGPKENKYLAFIKNNFLTLGLIFSVAPIFSLVYSEIIGFLPCFHCWVQRIFMFPQAFLFLVAYIRKDRNVFFYSLPLLLAGLADAIYLNYLYYFGDFNAPCDASGVSCVKEYVSEFGGYISIPMLALTSFVVLITINLVAYFYQKNNA